MFRGPDASDGPRPSGAHARTEPPFARREAARAKAVRGGRARAAPRHRGRPVLGRGPTATSRWPCCPRSRNARGRRRGRLAAAFAPESAEARYIYGLTLSAAGKPVDAAREYERAVALAARTRSGPLVVPRRGVRGGRGRRAPSRPTRRLIAPRPAGRRDRAGPRRVPLGDRTKTDEGNAAMEPRRRGLSVRRRRCALRYGRALSEQERFVGRGRRALEKARELGVTRRRDARSARTRLRTEPGASTRPARPWRRPCAAAPGRRAASARPRPALARGRTSRAGPRPSSSGRGRGARARRQYQLDLGRALEAAGRLDDAEAAYRKAAGAGAQLPRRPLRRSAASCSGEGKKEEAESELATHHALYERGAGSRRPRTTRERLRARPRLGGARRRARPPRRSPGFRVPPREPGVAAGTGPRPLSGSAATRDAVKALERARDLGARRRAPPDCCSSPSAREPRPPR